MLRPRLERRSMGAIASELIAQAAAAEPAEAAQRDSFSLPTKPMGKPLIGLEDAEAVRAAPDRSG